MWGAPGVSVQSSEWAGGGSIKRDLKDHRGYRRGGERGGRSAIEL